MDANSPVVCLDERAGPWNVLLEAPVLPFAVSACFGTCTGFYGAVSSTPFVVGNLLAAGLAALLFVRLRWSGVLSLVFALGLVVGDGARLPGLSGFDPDAPVTLDGRVASHPRGVPGEEWLWLRVRRCTQRDTTYEGSFEVLVGLPSADRPAELERPSWGQDVVLKGYLRSSPVVDHGIRTRTGPWRLNLPSWRFWDPTSEPRAWQRFATMIRLRVSERLTYPADSSLARRLRLALLLGSPDDLPDHLRRRLRATGLSHLLAVSGLHVGLLASWLWLVGMPCGRRGRWFLAIAGVGLYLLLVGPRASALRASGMAGIIALALIVRRPPQVLNAAMLWSTAMVLWDPQALDDLGFRLSVAATLGILMIGPGASRSLEWVARTCGLSGRGAHLICRALGASLAAQIATLPLLTPWTGLVHPGLSLAESTGDSLADGDPRTELCQRFNLRVHGRASRPTVGRARCTPRVAHPGAADPLGDASHIAVGGGVLGRLHTHDGTTGTAQDVGTADLDRGDPRRCLDLGLAPRPRGAIGGGSARCRTGRCDPVAGR